MALDKDLIWFPRRGREAMDGLIDYVTSSKDRSNNPIFCRFKLS